MELLDEPKRLEPVKETSRRLYLLSGNQCAFPHCDRVMVNTDGVFIGNIAHIEGVKGERFNASMTNEQRRSFENLVLLCYDHHQVTNDEARWTVDLMRKMKATHEGVVGELRTIKLVVGNVPREPQDFLLSRLVQAVARSVSEDTVTVLIGPRGVGKTQAAAYYARSMLNEQWGIVAWVNAETQDSLRAGLARIAEQLGVSDPDHDSLQSAINLRHTLEVRRFRTLLVLDNATDPDQVRDVLPVRGRARVLITTTHRSFASLGQAIDMYGFDLDQAVEFLTTAAPFIDDEGATRIASELACLPVALAQAAGTLRSLHITSGAYLDRLATYHISEVLERRLGDDYPRSTAAAIMMSLDAIADLDAPGLAWDILRLVSMLAPTGTPRDWLYRSILRDTSWSDLDIDTVLSACIESSVLSWAADGQALAAHRLVARAIRERNIVMGSFAADADAAMSLVETHLIPAEQAWKQRVLSGELVSHVEAVCANIRSHSDLPSDLRERASSLRDWAVQQVLAVSDFSRAVPMAVQGVADAIELFGTNDPRTWACYNRAGWAEIAANDPEPGFRHLEEAISSMSLVLGPDHRDTIGARKNLAASYRDAWRMDIALPMFRAVIDQAEAVLGADDAITLSAWSCLAFALQSASLFSESVAAYEHVCEHRRVILGPDHPKTLWSQGALAGAYRAGGRFEEAIRIFQGVLAIQERLEPGSAGLCLTQFNLAQSLEIQGHLEEATFLYESALRGREAVLGWEHPETVYSRLVLAQLFDRTGNHAKAVGLWEQVVLARHDVLGPEHPDSRWAQEHLANAIATASGPAG